MSESPSEVINLDVSALLAPPTESGTIFLKLDQAAKPMRLRIKQIPNRTFS